MGACGSTGAEIHGKYVDKKLTKKLGKDKNDDRVVQKVLLLGAGGSGKSTVFKQMRTCYGDGYPEEHRALFLPIIRQNMLEAIQRLVEESRIAGRQLSLESQDASMYINNLDAASDGNDMGEEESQHFAKMIKCVWTDPAIQATFNERATFVFTESSVSFLERIEEILSPDYQTTMDDVFLCRVRTSGIVEATFSVDSTNVKIVDVGGQRTERKKWIHCFENVTAILFIVDMSAYNCVLEEDGKTNCLEESFNLFQDICDCDWFRHSSIILFLNKQDLFQLKVAKVSIKDHHPLYAASHDEENAETVSEWIEDQFILRLPDSRKQIYVHQTNATSTSNFKTVFNAIKEHILVGNLARLGLA